MARYLVFNAYGEPEVVLEEGGASRARLRTVAKAAALVSPDPMIVARAQQQLAVETAQREAAQTQLAAKLVAEEQHRIAVAKAVEVAQAEAAAKAKAAADAKADEAARVAAKEAAARLEADKKFAAETEAARLSASLKNAVTKLVTNETPPIRAVPVDPPVATPPVIATVQTTPGGVSYVKENPPPPPEPTPWKPEYFWPESAQPVPQKSRTWLWLAGGAAALGGVVFLARRKRS